MITTKRQRRYHREKLSASRVSVLIGVLLGIGTAIALYSFQFVMFEALRMTSMVNYLDFVFLDDPVRQYVKLYFGAFSAVFGHAVAWHFILTTSQRNNPTRKYLVRYAIHDQTNLSWFTLYWVTSILWFLSMVYFGVFGTSKTQIPKVMIQEIVLLGVLTLFLNSYVGLRRLNRSKVYSWVLVSVGFVAVLSFSLSRWNPVNYNATDEIVKSTYPILKNPLDYPTVESGKRILKKTWNNYLFVQYDEEGDSLILTADNQTIDIEVVDMYLNYRTDANRYDIRPYITTVLSAHKETPMHHVNPVIGEALGTQSKRIAFAVNDNTWGRKEPTNVFPIFYPTGPISDTYNLDTLYIMRDNAWLLNGVKVSISELKTEFESRLLMLNQMYTIQYDSMITLDDYLQTYDLYTRIIAVKRTKLARSQFHCDYTELNKNGRKVIDGQCKWTLFDHNYGSKKKPNSPQ